MTVPEIRRIDPDAEAARLAEQRKVATRAGTHWPWPHLLCHAIVQVPPEMDVPDEHRAGIEITITSTMGHPVRADIADRIREAIWAAMREPEQ